MQGMQGEEERERGGRSPGQRRLLFWSFVVVLLGAAGVLLFWPHGPLQPEREETSTSSPEPGKAEQALQLYFADDEAQNMVSERRALPERASLEESVEAAIAALVAGPEEEHHNSVFPKEARLLQTYYTESTRTLFLDFNHALVDRHPGGSTAEYLTLGALVRTVAANFPQVTRLQILVDGQAIDTLAGHFDTSKPIEVSDWQ